jgi:hypothetical protein
MQLTPVQRLFKRIKHFFFPVRGWKTRVQQFRAGKIVWESTGLLKLPPMSPWPPEWTVMAIIPAGEGGATVSFCDTFSDVTGKEAKGEAAVRCARCGVNLHVEDTGMETNIDLPACSWCVGLISKV